jgi:hypothetical protein
MRRCICLFVAVILAGVKLLFLKDGGSRPRVSMFADLPVTIKQLSQMGVVSSCDYVILFTFLAKSLRPSRRFRQAKL